MEEERYCSSLADKGFCTTACTFHNFWYTMKEISVLKQQDDA